MVEFQTTLIVKKIIKLKEIVQRTIRSNQLYKTLGFIEATDLNACVIYAEAIYAKLTNLLPNLKIVLLIRMNIPMMCIL